ncbi:hypothetical protein [Kitasatospora sp. NPDC088346]|uniref:hypothetical protein n=1 Tax=Kitasatospora sp. NPDC088346 TaxID=3364073 RepID=UPI00380A739E
MNLDFSVDPLFSWYVVLLAISGVAMIGLGAFTAGQSTGMRVLNGLAGAAFLGYAIYLAFFFEGAEYRMFFQAFILPVLLIVKFVKGLTERTNAAPAQPAPAPDAAS